MPRKYLSTEKYLTGEQTFTYTIFIQKSHIQHISLSQVPFAPRAVLTVQLGRNTHLLRELYLNLRFLGDLFRNLLLNKT